MFFIFSVNVLLLSYKFVWKHSPVNPIHIASSKQNFCSGYFVLLKEAVDCI